jgi:RNA 2',3'-cyclic 3'-phosphodiesterase
MDNLRCFIAIDFYQDTLNRVRGLQEQLFEEGFHEIRWMRAENLHITLKFLGDTDREKIAELRDKMFQVSRTSKPFILDFKGMGVFPGWENPRIFWLGFERSAELQTLGAKIETVCKELGFAPEKRSFSPHLTIGRFIQSSSSPRMALLKDKCEQLKIQFPKEIVTSIHLYQSILKPSGAEYSRLFTSQLIG